MITEYFNGISDVLAGEYRVGVYGSYRVCEFARERWPAVPRRWQTYAWSRAERLEEVDLFQYENHVMRCGISVDLNEAYVEGW